MAKFKLLFYTQKKTKVILHISWKKYRNKIIKLPGEMFKSPQSINVEERVSICSLKLYYYSKLNLFYFKE